MSILYIKQSANTDDWLYKPGVAGGQIAYGGTAAGEDLEFHSTTHATKGDIVIHDNLVRSITGTEVGMTLTKSVTSTGNMITFKNLYAGTTTSSTIYVDYSTSYQTGNTSFFKAWQNGSGIIGGPAEFTLEILRNRDAYRMFNFEAKAEMDCRVIHLTIYPSGSYAHGITIFRKTDKASCIHLSDTDSTVGTYAPLLKLSATKDTGGLEMNANLNTQFAINLHPTNANNAWMNGIRIWDHHSEYHSFAKQWLNFQSSFLEGDLCTFTRNIHLNQSDASPYDMFAIVDSFEPSGSSSGVQCNGLIWDISLAHTATNSSVYNRGIMDVSVTGSNTANLFNIANSTSCSGHLFNLTNTGTGKDIDGTGSTWYATKDGKINAVEHYFNGVSTGGFKMHVSGSSFVFSKFTSGAFAVIATLP